MDCMYNYWDVNRGHVWPAWDVNRGHVLPTFNLWIDIFLAFQFKSSLVNADRYFSGVSV
jgi:hypothetical protein